MSPYYMPATVLMLGKTMAWWKPTGRRNFSLGSFGAA